jgi:phosphatidate phosphatase APP1
VLIGDSGEKDPEIYTAVARRFPQQVAAIAIREVAGKPRRKSLTDRLIKLRRQLPDGMLRSFREADELGSLLTAAAG